MGGRCALSGFCRLYCLFTLKIPNPSQKFGMGRHIVRPLEAEVLSIVGDAEKNQEHIAFDYYGRVATQHYSHSVGQYIVCADPHS